MDERLKGEYQEVVGSVSRELEDNGQWIEQYKNYAIKMLSHREAFEKMRSKFNEIGHLHYYLTIGKAKNNDSSFDIRYLGQSVGKISIQDEEAVLSVSCTQNNNSKKYFEYENGIIDNVSWCQSEKAKDFREFFNKYCEGHPRQKEHMVESALFSELGKKSSKNKQLCNITPISYAGTRIHMKTALRASDKTDATVYSKTGGEIDILCRRLVRPGESRLVVIEVKDENNKDESFDKAMKQAISYAVFVWKLIHSDAGEYWMDLFGMKKQKREGFTIDCVVAMPKGETTASYDGDTIDLIDGDQPIDHLSLHYMELTDIQSEDVKFNTSLK